MIRNEIKVTGILPKNDLNLIKSEDMIIESFNFELTEISDLSSVYELTLNIDSFNTNSLILKDSAVNTISFTLSVKILYSTPNNTINLKEYLFPYIYNLNIPNKVSKLFLLDCNLCINASSVSLALLIGFIKENPSIRIYKTKNYIKTTSLSNFDSTFDFL